MLIVIILDLTAALRMGIVAARLVPKSVVCGSYVTEFRANFSPIQFSG